MHDRFKLQPDNIKAYGMPATVVSDHSAALARRIQRTLCVTRVLFFVRNLGHPLGLRFTDTN